MDNQKTMGGEYKEADAVSHPLSANSRDIFNECGEFFENAPTNQSR